MIELDEQQVNRIVQKVLAEMAKTVLSPAQESEKAKVLVIFCGCPGDLEKISDEIQSLRGRFSFAGAYSQATEMLLGKDFLFRMTDRLVSGKDLYDAVDASEFLLFPNLSQNTAAKTVCGVRDSIGSEIMGYALQRGKNILACRSCICPGEKRDAYSLFLKTMLENLEKLGVRLYTRGKLEDVICNPKIKTSEKETMGGACSLVTASMVREANGRGLSRMDVNKGCIMTPLAKDEAKKLNIELHVRES